MASAEDASSRFDKLTASEKRVLINAFFCMQSVKVDFHKLAELSNLELPSSASRLWNRTRGKLGVKESPPDASAPAKSGKPKARRSRKRQQATEEAEEQPAPKMPKLEDPDMVDELVEDGDDAVQNRHVGIVTKDEPLDDHDEDDNTGHPLDMGEDV